jgi:hypothetical protein
VRHFRSAWVVGVVLGTVAGCGDTQAKPVVLGTVAVLAKQGDALDCCVTNQGIHDLTLLGIAIFRNDGSELGRAGSPSIPVPGPISPRHTQCLRMIELASAHYRCEIFGEGPEAEQALAGSLMIIVGSGDPNRVHAIVEAHRIPGTTAFVPSTRPCGETAPECNGVCPPDSPFCLRSGVDGSCFCGIR